MDKLESLELTIQELFEFLEIDNKEYEKEQFSDENIYLKSDKNELIPIQGYVKKNNKPIYKCTLETDEFIEVADTHIFRCKNEEILAKDSKGLYLDTLTKPILVKNVEFDGYDDVYDFHVPYPHWYTHNENFANGLISHNTTFLTNTALDTATQGKNVAYFTFEEQELEIRERIDGNLFNINTSELKEKGIGLKSIFESIISKGFGRIKIKAYGPRTASCLSVKAQLEDWKLKDNFIPDMIILDSITIMSPISKSDNLYTTGKAVSEEAKALAVDFRVPVVSAVQFSKGAYSSTNPDMSDVAESLAISQVSSAMLGIVHDEHRPDTRLLSIIKSRKVNKSKIKADRVHIDTDKQKVWDFNESEQKRLYIKQDEKEQLDYMNTVVEKAEIIDNSTGSTTLDQLFNR